MSNHSSEPSNSDGQGRSGSGQRNRNNRSGNRSGGRGGNRGNNRGGNRGGNRDDRRGGQQGRRSNSPQRSRPTPAPLSFWQKILKFFGVGKPPKRSSSSRVPKPEGQGNRNTSSRGERKPRNPKSGTRNSRSAQTPVETNRLYVGNLSYDATESDLEGLFNGAGTVASVEIVYNRNSQRSKGYAFIEMSGLDEAKRAVETLHDQDFMDRKLIVSRAKSKGAEGGGGGGGGGRRRSERSTEAPSDISPPEEDEVDERLGSPKEII